MKYITKITLTSFLCALSIISSTNSFSLTNNDFTTYRNDEFKFSFWYPKSWLSVQTTHKQTKIKVVSNSGKGVDDCNVVAVTNDLFRNYPPEDYIRDAKKGIPRILRKQYQDIKFIKTGVTSLSNKEAYYSITEATVKSYGISIPTTFLTVVTLDSNKKNGTQYIITCRTEPERFEKMHPIFKLILLGFVIKPSL